MKKKIVIKQGKGDDYAVSGSNFKPVELLNVLINILAYESCRLKKPLATPDSLWVAVSGSLCTAIYDQYTSMYGSDRPKLEWEKVS